MLNLFVTGATGFIGRAVLTRLAANPSLSITCLVRGDTPDWLDALGDRLTVVRGDINSPRSYEAAMRGCDLIVHMAALTGSAGEDDLRRVNVDGTASLLRCAAQYGQPRFLFVSSIAACYSDLEDYPYGKSKRDAESLVRDSGLPHVIVRPTIVLDRHAPNWPPLRKLATLPFVPLIGGGRALIQPVGLEDVARAIEYIILEFRDGEIVDLGGMEQLSFSEFFRSIRTAYGLGPPLVWIGVSVRLLRPVLRFAEGLFGVRAPVSPGQLVPFIENGTTSPSYITGVISPGLTPVPALLASIVDAGECDVVEQECVTFTRYLIDLDADDQIRAKYREGQYVVADGCSTTPMDIFMVAFARRSGWRTRAADSYARIFAPYGLLRRKLVYLLAILENSHSYHRSLTSGSAQDSAGRGALSVFAAGMGFIASFVAGTLLLGPSHLLIRLGRSYK